MIILTLNCGSSSLKYQVFDWDASAILGKGVVERIGQESSFIEHQTQGREEITLEHSCPTHKEAIQLVMDTIVSAEEGCIKSIDEIKAVGHRVVHGGEYFKKSVVIDEKVLEKFRKLYALAPLHNPANVQGIEAAMTVLPKVQHCAVMDTAWHQTMPDLSFMYALPYEWYKKHGVRRYGFHGTSYIYTAKRASVLLGKDPHKTNLIICHIGNGASICAVKDGKCYDTSMGLTPLEGLVMGTRSGDIDPAIIPFMMEKEGLTAKEVDTILNKKSGVLGLTEKFSDRRDIQAGVNNGDERCIMTQDMECYRIKKYIGSYAAALGRLDAVVFTAGVGEMNPNYRRKSISGLEIMGIQLDEKKNEMSTCRNAETDIAKDGAETRIFVIPTDEELVMTEDTYALIEGTYDVHTNFTYTFQHKDYTNGERVIGLERYLEKKPEIKKILATAK